jgi:hypothetical protein
MSCEEPKPVLTGRLSGPTDVELIKGCSQSNPQCDPATESEHLLLVANSLTNDLKIFHVEKRSFFSAPNPLFPLNIPVGRHPNNLDVDPYEEYAFVVNVLTEDVSVVGLSPDLLVELDTDGNQTTCDWPQGSDRCVLGVTRVTFGGNGLTEPDDIVCPQERTGEWEGPWDRQAPLPVYASLTGSGEIAVMSFNYPRPELGWDQQTMELVEVIDVRAVPENENSQPAGLAVTRDGSLLFAADRGSDSILVIDLTDLTVSQIDIGGPSHRVFLTPDDSMLYVVKISGGLISLVDVESLERVRPGETIATAVDPEASGDYDIRITAVPRSIGFVQGVPMPVYDEFVVPQEYTSELLTDDELAQKQVEDPEYTEHVVKTFAFVSDLNGNVYIIDAENHRLLDSRPFQGPTIGPVALMIGDTQVADMTILDCVGNPDCIHPHIAEFDAVYDGEVETRPIYHGIHVFDGVTRDDAWSIIYEGVIPGTEKSTSGRFDNFSLLDDRVGLDFVGAGVTSGDILEILSATECEEVSFDFQILEVQTNELVLDPVAGLDPEACWPEALRYQVRVGGAWFVLSSRSSARERLEMIPFTDPPPQLPAYINDYIALTLFEPGVDPATGEPYPVARDTVFAWTMIWKPAILETTGYF